MFKKKNIQLAFRALSVFVMLTMPLSTAPIVGADFVYASHTGIEPSLQVDFINGEDPGSFSCPDNPLLSPITIQGSGEGSAPPGKVEQYGVSVNWGDGSDIEETTSTFTPPSGNHVDFTFEFESSEHTYTTDGNYTITVTLFHSNTSGNDNQKEVDATATIETCIITTPQADLSIDKTVSPEKEAYAENEEITYLISVENTSDTVDFPVIFVNDLLPSGVTYVSHLVSQGSYADGIWDAGSISASSGATLAITVTVNEGTDDTQITNTATLDLTQCEDAEDPNSENNSDSITININNPAVCGDEVLKGPEICDDGGLNGTPNYCNSTCDGITTPVCGNETVEQGEACDDGELNGDPNKCNLDCTGTTTPFCGNAIEEAGEICDEGELNGTPNHCNNLCTGNTLATCGNSTIEQGEICDDGELNGDPNKCNLDCTGTTTPVCGNEVTEEGETCDEGGLNGTPNHCSSTCDGTTGATCGNEILEQGEICDDGELNGTPNYCSNTCDGTTESICGNNIIEGEEQCDGEAGEFGENEACGEPETENACKIIILPFCGDFNVDDGEECDAGSQGSESCTAQCTAINNSEQGSICGYKFNDQDRDGLFDGDESGISSWNFFLQSVSNLFITSTNEEGRYCFMNLGAGSYDVFEEIVSGWATTTDATTTVTLVSNIDSLDNINFGNTRTTCADGIDNDGNGVSDANDPGCHTDGDQTNENSYDPNDDDENSNECSDNIDNDNDEVIDFADPACHTDGDAENEESYDPSLDDESDLLICTDSDGDGFFAQGGECGPTDCNDSAFSASNTCGGGGGGGGGGGSSPNLLIIHTEKVSGAVSGGTVTATLTWHTNKPANSRVVYGTQSVGNNIVITPPNYGYQSSTLTFDTDPKVTFHTVVITGLIPKTKYYFRPLSAASPEVYGVELEFTTDEAVITPETPVIPPTTPTSPNTPGTVAGVATEEGTVAGVEFVEEAQAQVIEEQPEIAEEVVETTDEPATKDCTVFIWILLIINLLAIAYAASKSKSAKNSTTKNAWWILILLVIVPVVIAYPQCWLVIWLIITLIAAVILISSLTKKNEGKQA